MTKRTLEEAKAERRKRWKAIEARQVPAEVAVYGFASLAAMTATSLLYLVSPTPFLAISFSVSLIAFAATCAFTIKHRR